MNKKVFLGLLGLCLFTPLVFLPNFYTPLLSPKIFYFILLIELCIPFLVYTLLASADARVTLKHPITVSLFVYFGLMSVSAILGVDPWNSFFGNASRVDGLFLRYHLFFFFVSLAVLFQTWEGSRRFLLRLFLGVAAAVGGIGFFQLLHLLPMTDTFESRASSTIGNPVFFAASMVIPFFLSVGIMLQEKNRGWKWIYGLCALLIGLGILASQTRGASLGVLVGMITWGTSSLFLHVTKGQRKKIALSAIALLFVVGLMGLTARELSTEGSLFYRLTHYADASVTSRLTYWRLAVVGWLDNPWLGVGHQNFYRIADKYYPNDLYEISGNWPDKPHNQILEILATGGVLTLLSYLVYLFFIVSTILRRPSSQDWISKTALLSALAAYLVQNLFVFNTIVPLISFYFFLGVLYFAPAGQDSNATSRIFGFARFLPAISVSVPILIGLLFVYPTAVQFYIFGHVLSQDNENRTQQADHLDRVSHMTFVYDDALLANLYSDALQQELDMVNSETALSRRLLISAREMYKRTVERHPYRAYDWYRAARVELTQAMATDEPVPEEGIAMATEAIRLAPTRVEALVVLANMQIINGDADEAVETLERALTLAPNYPDALFTLALLRAREGDLARAAPLAVESLREGAQLKNVQALDWIITYYVDLKDTATVVFLYESAVEIEPDDPELLPKLAAAYAQNGQTDKAIETALRYRSLNPDYAPAVDVFIDSLK